jgi:hypothetical protein
MVQVPRDDLRAVVARATPDDAWTIVENLVNVLEREEDTLDAAFTRDEGARWWASPDEIVTRLLAWASPDATATEGRPRVSFVEGAPGVSFDVRSQGTTGLAPFYGARPAGFPRPLVYRRDGDRRLAALAPALSQRFVVGNRDVYHVYCWRWHRYGEYNRIHRIHPGPREKATQFVGSNLDRFWVTRNEATLATLRAGRYMALRVSLVVRDVDDAPFSHVDGWPDDDDKEIDLPERVRHFIAGPFEAEKGPTEVALLPTGGTLPAPAVAYAWRAPEELALDMHGLVDSSGRTRIWGMLLQGEGAVAAAAASGEPVVVTMVMPCAWAGEIERLVQAVAPMLV